MKRLLLAMPSYLRIHGEEVGRWPLWNKHISIVIQTISHNWIAMKFQNSVQLVRKILGVCNCLAKEKKTDEFSKQFYSIFFCFNIKYRGLWEEIGYFFCKFINLSVYEIILLLKIFLFCNRCLSWWKWGRRIKISHFNIHCELFLISSLILKIW